MSTHSTFYPTDGNVVVIQHHMKCLYCPESVLGDPKYHEVYDSKGLLVGYRHRRCKI